MDPKKKDLPRDQIDFIAKLDLLVNIELCVPQPTFQTVRMFSKISIFKSSILDSQTDRELNTPFVLVSFYLVTALSI